VKFQEHLKQNTSDGSNTTLRNVRIYQPPPSPLFTSPSPDFTFVCSVIEDSVQKVKAPQNIVEAEPALIGIFKGLVREFSRFQKRSSLKLDLVSPTLISKTKSSSIPVPGQQDSLTSDSIVTIQSFSTTVAVLPTKTKPKKIIIIGSDGNKYPFLLKGREDLHLDERIMQFLVIVNQLLKRDKQVSFF